MSDLSEAVAFSVIVPVFNESGSVAPLQVELVEVLLRLNAVWEIIWIDDGSTDTTQAELASLITANVRLVCFQRHLGQSAALWVGLQAARGETIVTIDGDGQNDPRDIPQLLSALAHADMVIGNRINRRDSIAKRIFAGIANSFRNHLTRSRLPDSGCGLRAFRRQVLDSLIPFDGMHRFLPTLAEISDFRVVSVEVNHRPRLRGHTKYGIIDRLMGPFLDCLMLSRLKRRRLINVSWHELRAVSEQVPGADGRQNPWQAPVPSLPG